MRLVTVIAVLALLSFLAFAASNATGNESVVNASINKTITASNESLTSNVNKTKISETALKTDLALKSAEEDLREMTKNGLPATRYSDNIAIARQMYEAQLALEGAGGKPDYSIVLDKINELKVLKQMAFRALDELKVLNATINQTSGVDLAPVLELYSKAREEFKSERYEESLALVDKAYKKISELEATQTKIKAIYEATYRNLEYFLKENWREVAVSLAALAAVIALTYNRIICWRLEKAIHALEGRKNVVRKLIAETQKDYFENNKVSESTYHIRTKKYAELIRDINRQIPLLKEELAMRRKRRI
ncbi:hypothetical protein HY991_05935 [Candidatus Micrarchaeota archaeon]|nr:hypothetical protein [Candidatus Micrarchaeota archaeon]